MPFAKVSRITRTVWGIWRLLLERQLDGFGSDSLRMGQKIFEELRATTKLGEQLRVFARRILYSRKCLFQMRGSPPSTKVAVLEVHNILAQAGKKPYEAKAIFGDLTVKFSDRFDTQLGMRHSWLDVWIDSSAQVPTLSQQLCRFD